MLLSRPEISKGIQHSQMSLNTQDRTLSLLLADPPQSLVVQFMSAADKTAAFTANILHRLDAHNPNPQALVLTHSRELARNISGIIGGIGQFIDGLKVTAAIPGPSSACRSLDGHIIVGTPGIIYDRIRRAELNPRFVKILVLDGVDEMLHLQLGDVCERVKEYPQIYPTPVLFKLTALQTAAEKYPSGSLLRHFP